MLSVIGVMDSAYWQVLSKIVLRDLLWICYSGEWNPKWHPEVLIAK